MGLSTILYVGIKYRDDDNVIYDYLETELLLFTFSCFALVIGFLINITHLNCTKIPASEGSVFRFSIYPYDSLSDNNISQNSISNSSPCASGTHSVKFQLERMESGHGLRHFLDYYFYLI